MGIGIKDGIRLEFILSRPGILSVLQKTQEIGCADPRRCAPVDTGTSNSSVKKRRFFGDLIKQPSPKMFFWEWGQISLVSSIFITGLIFITLYLYKTASYRQVHVGPECKRLLKGGENRKAISFNASGIPDCRLLCYLSIP